MYIRDGEDNCTLYSVLLSKKKFVGIDSDVTGRAHIKRVNSTLASVSHAVSTDFGN